MNGLTTLPTARELLALDSEQAERRLRALSPAQQRELVLQLPPGRRRQDLLLLSDRPAMLLRLLPPEDFLLTVKEIGEPDALALIELSSNAQLTYALDLDLWRQTDLDLVAADRWWELLLECGPERFIRWVEHSDFELQVLLFERWCLKLERDELGALTDSLSRRVISPDNTHYLLVKLGADLDHVRAVVDLLFHHAPDRFGALVANLGTTPPAELEELALRWRNARLADRGWPRPDEAQAVYGLLDPQRLESAPLPAGVENPPRYALERVASGRLLAAAIDRVAEVALRERLALQLANLINRVLVTDGLEPTDPEMLERAGRVVAGRIELGLDALGIADAEAAAGLLARNPLLHLAQVGNWTIQRRARRARALLQASADGLFELLAAPRPDRLRALAAPRPVLLERAGELPRPLAGRDDLVALERDLDRAEAALLLAQRLGLGASRLPQPFPTGCWPEALEGLSLEMLLLTAFAHGSERPQPLAPIAAERLDALAAGLPEQRAELRALLEPWAAAVIGDSPPAGLPGLLDELTGRLAAWATAHRHGARDPRYQEALWVIEQPGG